MFLMNVWDRARFNLPFSRSPFQESNPLCPTAPSCCTCLGQTPWCLQDSLSISAHLPKKNYSRQSFFSSAHFGNAQNRPLHTPINAPRKILSPTPPQSKRADMMIGEKDHPSIDPHLPSIFPHSPHEHQSRRRQLEHQRFRCAHSPTTQLPHTHTHTHITHTTRAKTMHHCFPACSGQGTANPHKPLRDNNPARVIRVWGNLHPTSWLWKLNNTQAPRKPNHPPTILNHQPLLPYSNFPPTQPDSKSLKPTHHPRRLVFPMSSHRPPLSGPQSCPDPRGGEGRLKRIWFGSDSDLANQKRADRNRIQNGSKSDRNRIQNGSKVEIGSKSDTKRIQTGSEPDPTHPPLRFFGICFGSCFWTPHFWNRSPHQTHPKPSETSTGPPPIYFARPTPTPSFPITSPSDKSKTPPTPSHHISHMSSLIQHKLRNFA